MPEIDLFVVLVAALVAFLLSSVYYAMLASHLAGAGAEASASTRPPPWKLGVEIVRSALLAAVVAALGTRCGVQEWSGGLLLGLALWIGFPLVLWTGAVLWEGSRLHVAAVHLGDWLMKLLAVAVITCAWR